MDARLFTRFLLGSAPLLLSLVPGEADAVPSFARQTGLNCATCHTVFPQLTPFGRNFKLHGYTFSSEQSSATNLQEGSLPPLSAMLTVAYTQLKSAQPDTQNGNVEFPAEFSLFYAGRISDKLGAFIQATYEGAEDNLSMDNADIRIADDGKLGGKNVVYGLTLNNNPTVQDLWNSTPVWGFPYASSGTAPTPAAAARIDGSLGQEVAGLGAYALWNNWVYGELGVYRSAPIGGPQPPDPSAEDVIQNTAPYWRLAVQHDWGPHSFEFGTYGMAVHSYPGAATGTPLSGPTDDFRDLGLDAQYQYLNGDHTWTAHANWIHEKQSWDASFPGGLAANPEDSLDTLRLDATYYYQRRIGGSLGVFDTSGDRDTGLYAPAPVEGSRTGKPDSRGWIGELDYVPWLNTKFSLQYTAYDKFNGAGSNYDGAGRSASDNNTLFLNAWLLF